VNHEEKDLLIDKLTKEIGLLELQYKDVLFQLTQLRKIVYGSKRERFKNIANPKQSNLFESQGEDNLKEESDSFTATQVMKKPAATKSRKGVKRNKFPENLRRVEQVINPEGLNLDEYIKIGEDITEILVVEEARIYVQKIIRPKFKLKSNGLDTRIVQAPIPVRILPKGMVDESVMAHIINQKIQFHLPLYRQSKQFRQMGLDFIRKTNIESWYGAAVCTLIPLYHLLIEDVMKQVYLQVDESSIKVLTKNKPGSAHRGQMWVAHAPIPKAVLYHYDPNRSEKAGANFLANFQGEYIQSDGYVVYENIARKNNLELIFCQAHSRRKFYQAKEAKSHVDLCNYYIEKIQQLYAIERRAREEGLNHEKRLELRKRESVPILEQLKKWLTKHKDNLDILPTDRLYKAINYTYKRWNGLSKYCEDGRLEIDNNLVENTIRPLALGRKNYLFAGSDQGAINLAICYSLVNTCLKNNIHPEKYLTWVLKKIANNKVNPQAVEWLPHRLNAEIRGMLSLGNGV
jgi:transposase